jgi:hypothetical protein
MTRLFCASIFVFVFVLSACGGGGVVRKPQPIPPGTSPVTQAELAAAVTKNAFATGSAPSRIAVNGGKVYTLNALANTLTVHSASDYSLESTVSFPVGAGPYSIIFSGSTAYICTNGDNRLYRYRAGQSTLDDEFVSLTRPETESWAFIGPGDMAIDGNRLYIPLSGIISFGDASRNIPAEYAPGKVAVVNLNTFQFDRFIDVGNVNPTVCYVNEAAQLFIVCTGELQFDSNFEARAESDGEVVFYNATSNSVVHRVNLGKTLPSAIISPNAVDAYIGSNLRGEVYKIRLDNGTVLRGPANPITLTSGFTYVSGFAGLPGIGVIALSFNTDEAFFIDPLDDSVSKSPFSSPFRFRESETFFGGLQHAAFYDALGAKKLFVILGVSNQAGVIDFTTLWDRIRLGEG